MKTTKTIALILAVIMCLALTEIPVAAASLIDDSAYWKNVTGEEATALLNSTKTSMDKSFVLVYYSSGCSYSQNALPGFAEYAKENKLKVYALNALDEPSGWYGWSGFIKEYPTSRSA